MAGNHREGVPSRAAIFGHPIHPMLIPFPIAFLVGALGADLAYWWVDDAFWARAALWLTGTGFLAGAAAAIFGLTDFIGIGRAREHAAGWIHFLGNGTALTLALVSWLIRLGGAADAVLPWGLTLSVVIAGILTVTGWYGGDLSYRHLIGVTGHGGERTQEPPGRRHVA